MAKTKTRKPARRSRVVEPTHHEPPVAVQEPPVETRTTPGDEPDTEDHTIRLPELEFSLPAGCVIHGLKVAAHGLSGEAEALTVEGVSRVEASVELPDGRNITIAAVSVADLEQQVAETVSPPPTQTAARYWPPDQPLPTAYVRQRLPCPTCRCVTTDDGGQAAVLRSTAADLAYLRCRACGHKWKLRLREKAL